MRIGIALLFVALMVGATVAAGIYLLARLSRRSPSDEREA